MMRDDSPVRIDRAVPMDTADGTRLMATVYRPADDRPCPVLLMRTPYGKDLSPVIHVIDPERAAADGFMVVVQDVRGRYASEGEWNPYVSEAEDGAAAVAWAAALPGADGRIGMYGASYQGAALLAAASRRPPTLRGIAPMLCWRDPANGQTFRGGALELGKLVRWTLMNMGDRLARRIPDRDEAERMIAACAADLATLDAADYRPLPLSEQPLIRRYDPRSEFFDYLARADAGMLDWPALAAPDERHDVPALWIAGWFDAFLGDMIGNWQDDRAAGLPSRLVVGPWTHASHKRMVGEVDHGADAETIGAERRTFHDLLTGWFRHVFDDAPVVPPAVVTSFAMGSNRWQAGADFPPDPTAPLELFLDAHGRLAAEAPASAGSASYRYDPEDPAPTIGGATLMGGAFPAGPRDQSPLAARGDVLTFAGEPLVGPRRAAGWVSATLWVESDAPATDFVARLIDIAPDGRAIGVTDGILHRRYEPATATEIAIDLWATDHLFAAGHRIELQVTSSSFPRWQRALNVDAPLGEATESRPAQQRIRFGGHTPSRLTIGAPA